MKHFISLIKFLDDLININEVRFNQETLHLIIADRSMIEFKQTTSDIDILSKEFNLNGDELQIYNIL